MATININTATGEELRSIEGIGPNRCQLILDARGFNVFLTEDFLRTWLEFPAGFWGDRLDAGHVIVGVDPRDVPLGDGSFTPSSASEGQGDEAPAWAKPLVRNMDNIGRIAQDMSMVVTALDALLGKLDKLTTAAPVRADAPLGQSPLKSEADAELQGAAWEGEVVNGEESEEGPHTPRIPARHLLETL